MSQIDNYLRCVGRVARMHEALVVWLNLAKLFRFFSRRSLRFWLLDGILLFPTLGCGAIAVVLGLFNRTVNSTVCCCFCLGILKRTVLFGVIVAILVLYCNTKV